MDQALHRAADVALLRGNTALTAVKDGYRYQIAGPLLSVSDGTNVLTAPIRWAFGNGKAGQTYVLEHEGRLLESRVSFYRSLGALDLTLGAANRKPATLRQALGREMSAADVRECFGCHADGGKPFDIAHLTPGVTCERCHGPGSAHADAFQRGDRTSAAARIENPGRLTTEEVSEFCGQCHRTWAQVVEMRIRGVNNVRFQPYRLARSRCYDATDSRISCVACHNPHQAVETRAAAYDARCVACHRPGEQKPCPQAKSNCVTCHMTKVELPGTHFRFADHRIRVVRAGEAYPD